MVETSTFSENPFNIFYIQKNIKFVLIKFEVKIADAIKNKNDEANASPYGIKNNITCIMYGNNKINKIFFILIGVFLLSSCMNKYDKSNHQFTTEICKGYYLETYNVFSQGAFGTDVYADYLTDSNSFRLFIDTYNTDNEAISFSMKADTIILTKYHYNKNRDKSIIYSKKFPIIELELLNEFE